MKGWLAGRCERGALWRPAPCRCRFLLDQDIAVEGGNLSDSLENFLHGRRAANNLPKTVRAVRGLIHGQLGVTGTLQGVADDLAQIIQAKGLCYIIESAELDGLHRLIDGGVTGHEDDHGLRGHALDLLQHLHALASPRRTSVISRSGASLLMRAMASAAVTNPSSS